MQRLLETGLVTGLTILLLVLSGCAKHRATPDVAASMAADFVAISSGRLQSTDLIEASGLAASRIQAGILWAINDSGNRPVLFALDASGADRGQVTLGGVENGDWEDLAAFNWHGEPWLLVADVGDNPGRRSSVVLHALPEPQADERGRFYGVVRPAWSLTFTNPDGPRDCEAVAVDEAAGQILLLSKRSDPPMLYRLPLAPPVDARSLVATLVGPLDTIPPPTPADLLLPYGRYRSQPTAMDLSADGSELLILTYRHAYLLHRIPGQEWSRILAEAPQAIALPGLLDLAQREAACFSADGQSLFVTGEGEGAALLRLGRQ
jgi:hypothetical protein